MFTRDLIPGRPVRPISEHLLKACALGLWVLVAAGPAFAGTVTLSWSEPAGGEDGFMIERSTDGINFEPIASVPAGVTNYVDPNTESGTNYDYEVCAFNAVGSSAFTLPTSTNPGRLTNVSCRAQIAPGAGALTVGFVVGGSNSAGPESLLVRVSGPSLAGFGVSPVLPDPQLSLNAGATVIASNSGWAGNPSIAAAAAAVGAFAWTDTTSLDAAVVEALQPGAYTAVATGVTGDSGIGLVEVYDTTPSGAAPTTSRLINISSRASVGTGSNVLIVGFVVGGTTPTTVLVRASGPALASFGVPGVLLDPELTVSDPSHVFGSNSGWGGDPQITAAGSATGAFAWNNPASTDSALLLSLPPGAYTATVSGASGDTGVALVEVYIVP